MKNNKGFTLLEILLVVAIIAILAGIVIIAINPNKQLADSRNAQRKVDVNTILNAVYQYSIDNDGNLPSTITGTATEICAGGTATSTCTSASLIPLNHLIWSEKYLTAIPSDPSGSCSTNGVCYTIATSTNGRVTVAAPNAEQGTTISVTR